MNSMMGESQTMKLRENAGGSETILKVDSLRVQFGSVNAVSNVSFELNRLFIIEGVELV